ncbi:MAG: hypothetical protein KW793_04265 [Candidatus Doudnabacteria bacterium]|nr:hypothetical protein [Candidatus Doudnabacteria bacterium]
MNEKELKLVISENLPEPGYITVKAVYYASHGEFWYADGVARSYEKAAAFALQNMANLIKNGLPDFV